MKIHALASMILAVPIAIAAEPSPEMMLPTVYDRDAYTPSVAFGKDVFLVAWQSGRNAAGDVRQGLRGDSDIVAMRVGRDGKAIDEKPFAISTAADSQQAPRVAFGGGVFLVVWHDRRKGKDWDVYGTRVTPEGKVLDAEGIAICTAPQSQALPRVAWDGKAFQVVWQDYRSSLKYEVGGARVSPEGKLLEGQNYPLESEGGFHRYAPAIASTGSGKSFLVWSGDIRLGKGTTTGGMMLRDGVPAFPVDTFAAKQGPGFEYVPMCLAAGAGRYLAAWTTDCTLGRDAKPGDTNACLFDHEGKRLPSFLLAGKPHRIRDPEAVWNGKEFVAVWHEAVQQGKDSAASDAVFASRVSGEGKVSDVTKLAGDFKSPAAQASVASDEAGITLAVYERHPATGEEPIRVAFRVIK